MSRESVVSELVDLYKGLSKDIFPEIPIAEEACLANAGRNIEGRKKIYKITIGHSVKSAVTDDYTRMMDVSNPRAELQIGDTVVFRNQFCLYLFRGES